MPEFEQPKRCFFCSADGARCNYADSYTDHESDQMCQWNRHELIRTTQQRLREIEF